MKRVTALAAICLALTACGDNPGDDAAQAACHAYAMSPGSIAEGVQLRTTATQEAHRAAEADDAYGAIPHDMADAYSRSDAIAAEHNGGQQVSARELDGYVEADRRVRQDCMDAGADIGPLEP